MKLLRYGPAGQEKPGVLDAQGRVRDLSGHIADLAGSDAIQAQHVAEAVQYRRFTKE